MPVLEELAAALKRAASRAVGVRVGRMRPRRERMAL
jgi:hypothetical protein